MFMMGVLGIVEQKMWGVIREFVVPLSVYLTKLTFVVTCQLYVLQSEWG